MPKIFMHRVFRGNQNISRHDLDEGAAAGCATAEKKQSPRQRQ